MTEIVHRMKRASLVRLIDWLKGSDDQHWDMSETLKVRDDTVSMEMMQHGEYLDRIPLCHTVGCFAGHCVLLQAVDKQMMVPIDTLENGGIIALAETFMGINDSDDHLTLKEFLFTPNISYYDVTREIAIQVLEHIRDKGVLHWGKFLKVSGDFDGGNGLHSPLPVVLY